MIELLYSIETIILLLGLTLIIMESVLPGIDLIVAGTALLTSGIILFLIPISSPIVTILTLTVISYLTIKGYDRIDLYGPQGDKTSDGSSLSHAEGIALEDITPNKGRVRLNRGIGTMNRDFQARSPIGKIREGTKIYVKDSGGGNVLEVVPLDDTKRDELYDIRDIEDKEEKLENKENQYNIN